jgi:predicted glycoside hydrolase/deacetylase ChbG (UPF0249 family)
MGGFCKFMNSTKTIIVNADDLGYRRGINEAIACLSNRRLITSTSLMVYGNIDDFTLSVLNNNKTLIGLHLDFTSEFSKLRHPSIAAFYGRCISGFIKLVDVRREIDSQLNLFRKIIGRYPDFVDGHQHVHQFPLVRNALLDALSTKYPITGIRSTLTNDSLNFKAKLIQFMGAVNAERLFLSAGHSLNNNFLGVYDFSVGVNYRQHWRRWLSLANEEGTLVMCHPSLNSEESSLPIAVDQIADARISEFNYLISNSFKNDLGVSNSVVKI